MKKLYLIILILIGSISFSIGQEDNYGGDVLDTTLNNFKSSYIFTPNPNGTKKYIRLIIHFLLKDDGTGNFNEVNDGLNPANIYSGYAYAEYIVDYMNSHMSNPCEMHLQPFGPIPVYDCEYRFELVGTYFWRSTANYNADLSTLQNTYGKNKDECINIFLINDINSSGGYVRYLGDNAVWSGIHYQRYIDAVNNNNTWYNSFTQRLLNHEIGHCFNLHHTLMTGNGVCTNNYNDYCDDTPTIQDMLDLGEPDPCCWNASYCSNNLMDYNAQKCALTPDQLGRVHEELDNNKYYYWRNHFTNPQVDICNITNSNTYIGKKVTVSKNCTSVINNGTVVFINASEVELYPGFIIYPGGSLTIKTNKNN